MANVFVNLPLPVMSGVGAAVDTSGQGATKTIVVDGTFQGCLLTVEVSEGGAAVAASKEISSDNMAAMLVVTAVTPGAAGNGISLYNGDSAHPGSETDVGSVVGLNDGAPGVRTFQDIADFINASSALVTATVLGVNTTSWAGGAITAFAGNLSGGQDASAGDFVPIASFQSGENQLVVDVVAAKMRIRVSGRKATVPFSASIDVGAAPAKPTFASIPLPSGNGIGAAVDLSNSGLFTTFVCAGEFLGVTIIVEVSEDGLAYAPLVSFAGRGGVHSQLMTAQFVRANVSGRKSTVPFSASLSVGAVESGGGGGGGGNRQTFRYIADGLEDPNGFPIALPAIRSSVNYNAQVTGGGLTDQLTFDVPVALQTTSAITVRSSAALTAGDILLIAVEDLT